MCLGDDPNFRAWPLPLVREPEEGADLADGEPEGAGATNEVSPNPKIGTESNDA
jgi:hypothetical protein